MNTLIKTLSLLTLLILASCGMDEGRNLMPGETIGSDSVVYQTRTLNYSCNGDTCWVNGQIGVEQIISSELNFTGNVYYSGQICTINGCLDYKLAPMLKTLELI